MPQVVSDGAEIFWREDGQPGRPVLLLLNSLGCDHRMWDPVVGLLRDRFRLLQMDMRGHGSSSVPLGDYTIAQLGGDALAVLDAAGVASAAVCGVSLGGMVSMWLAENAPERFWAIVPANTTAEVARAPWDDRLGTIRAGGLQAIVDVVMGRFLSEGFRAKHPSILEAARRTFLGLNVDGYAGCCAAIRELDVAKGLGGIALPTLVVAGTMDQSTPPEQGRKIAATVPGAEYVELPTAHLSCVEMPEAFAGHVLGFLSRHLPGNEALGEARRVMFEDGLVNRRQVLGDAWVDKSLANRNHFNGEFQEFITRIAWSEIWGRPGLDHRTRRLLVLATTIALGRWEEFRLHARAGIEQGGMTVEDLKEVIMQSAIYAGVPAANTAFHHGTDLLRELGRL